MLEQEGKFASYRAPDIFNIFSVSGKAPVLYIQYRGVPYTYRSRLDLPIEIANCDERNDGIYSVSSNEKINRGWYDPPKTITSRCMWRIYI